MRISDWSSDVCSSDLRQPPFLAEPVGPSGGAEHGDRPVIVVAVLAGRRDLANIFDGRRGGAATEARAVDTASGRSEEHTSELQSLMRISYAGVCWKKKCRPHA